jgi:hypothetical protein
VFLGFAVAPASAQFERPGPFPGIGPDGLNPGMGSGVRGPWSGAGQGGQRGPGGLNPIIMGPDASGRWPGMGQGGLPGPFHGLGPGGLPPGQGGQPGQKNDPNGAREINPDLIKALEVAKVPPYTPPPVRLLDFPRVPHVESKDTRPWWLGWLVTGLGAAAGAADAFRTRREDRPNQAT